MRNPLESHSKLEPFEQEVSLCQHSFTPFEPFRSKLGLLSALALGTTLTFGALNPEPAHASGSSSAAAAARFENTNAIAVIVSGLASQEIWGDALVDLNVNRTAQIDSRITGTTSKHKMDLDIQITAVFDRHFTAYIDNNNQANGTFVIPWSPDWQIVAQGNHSWKLSRPYMVDHHLELHVGGGQISGAYLLPFQPDWHISGSYTPAGQIQMKINIPYGFDLMLQGAVSQSK